MSTDFNVLQRHHTFFLLISIPYYLGFYEFIPFNHFFDAIDYKVRDRGKIVSKAADCLGVHLEGKRDILGIWVGNEGAS
jgi:hypothetical protein